MNDLTEQWKKGELPRGWYWVDYYSVDGAVMLEYIPQHNGFGYEEKELVQAVLAEVPDYVEWQASEKYNKHLEEKIKIYELKDKQATETSIAYTELLEENAKLKEIIEKDKKIFAESKIYPAHLISEDFHVKYDIDKLKELLKECKKMLMQSNYQNMTQYHEVLELRDKIDEVLGEK